jgi:hypothetical protein
VLPAIAPLISRERTVSEVREVGGTHRKGPKLRASLIGGMWQGQALPPKGSPKKAASWACKSLAQRGSGPSPTQGGLAIPVVACQVAVRHFY